MSEHPFQILPTDTRWPGPWHVEEGPDCLCSRCGLAILEPEIAIRAWPEDANRYSYRFHPACLGMYSPPPMDEDGEEPEPDDEPEDLGWLCVAGHVHEDGCHCPLTGEEPPWGCPCSQCQGDREVEEEDPVLEWELLDMQDEQP